MTTLMIVDDSTEILGLYRTLFKRRGYEVVEANDGAEALDMLDSASPDLFILDVMMPGLNGIELCKRIRAMPAYEHTPIIVLSAYSESGIIEQMFSAGANDYALKPINPIDLEAKVHELLGTTAG